MSSELILIRHGESEANASLTEHPDSRLTELGVRQALEVGQQLRNLDLRRYLCLVSPYERTLRTAEHIAAVTGLNFEQHDLVREWGLSATVGGKHFQEEQKEELVLRLREFLQLHPDRNLLLVSHAAPIAVLTQLACGENPNTEGAFWTGVGNCCLLRVRRTGGAVTSSD